MSDSDWEKEAAFWEGYHTARREALEEAAVLVEQNDMGYAPVIAAAIRKLMEQKDE